MNDSTIKDIWADNAVITDEDGERYSFDYYVREYRNSADKCPVYGLRIKTDSKIKKPDEATYGITYELIRAEEWAHRLAEGGVTPITLHNVVDGWIED